MTPHEEKTLAMARGYLESQGLQVERARRGSGYDLKASDGSVWEEIA